MWRRGVLFAGIIAVVLIGGQITPAFAARANAKPTQVVQAGSYSGLNGYLSFWVEPGGKKIVDVLESADSLACAPGGGGSGQLLVSAIPIKADGSFSSKTTQRGVFQNQPATFIYTFAGRFQPPTATTPAGATGSYREDVVVSGAIEHCTTNPQTWTASRYAQPIPKNALVKSGSYSGLNGYFKFTVAGKRMLNVAMSATSLACLPSSGTNDHLQVSSIPIKPDGSFSATVSTSGVYQNVTTKYTYTVAGYFEGPTSTGAATVAGYFREDMKPSSGATTMCTTDNQPWQATLSS